MRRGGAVYLHCWGGGLTDRRRLLVEAGYEPEEAIAILPESMVGQGPPSVHAREPRAVPVHQGVKAGGL
jgi:hypothetical protein